MTTVGLVGCGVIADTYASKLKQLDDIDLVACADLDADRATGLAEEHGIPRILGVEELISDSDVGCVVNLTPPLAHREVLTASLQAGKPTFSEKPLGVDFAEGTAVVELAAQRGLRLGCAPDTFLGAGAQTARRAIDEGMIGEPIAANANFLGAGPESWHPGPDIFYKLGAGPMLDMGPYYLTSLVNLLGPGRRVTAVNTTGSPQREIAAGPRQGELIDVEVPTHVVALIEFESGSTATVTTSFDVEASRIRPGIEIYGSEATLVVPDPNWFGGDVQIRSFGDPEWRVVPNQHANVAGGRGLGLAEMLWAERNDRPHRASGELALHVLELMTAAISSGEQAQGIDLATRCDRPATLPVGLDDDAFG